MQTPPSKHDIDTAVEAASDAAAHARHVRERLGRRRTARREDQLTAARQRCTDAAVPLRSYIGMVAWHDFHIDQELAMKNAIAALRYERRQIDKML